ncbi:bile acid:sodium symporter family protein [Croceicoccus sp. F390]|uniref:Bile acid:sodium symporter family protein n=1 Tax=Croceicoccus esteveae TaxID=3075597 RepID=A0ABU2ZFM7_9SPHN|nr:bile acid:sodium symporter family protein [Croceicoccus sp. F390]MDT0575405.1 bile acid:sodium symporter family protein [Croceicoccus sp. F390]
MHFPARLRPDGFVLALLATVLIASFLPARGGAADFAQFIADAAIVFLFFLHGAKLSRAAVIAGAVHWRLHLAVLAMTFGIFPVLGLLLTMLPLLDPDLAAGVLFLSAAPSTVQSSVAFTAIAGGNVAAAVCSAALSSLLGVFLTPALVTLLIGGEQAGQFTTAAIVTIMLQLVAPFLAGHLLRPMIGRWIEARAGLVSLADRGAILLVVYAAFGAAVAEGLWTRTGTGELLLVLLICVVMLVAALMLSAIIGRVLGFCEQDRIVILFCGSKKSLAAGVPIAGVLFPAATVGTIILPLMIFHQIQLIVCAWIARWYAQRNPSQGAENGGDVSRDAPGRS